MSQSPLLPLPISYVHGRYLLFSATAASYLRREHNIGGVLFGSLPQIPQQNVFLGLPLELMPEEARVLVDNGIAYLRDDRGRHEEALDGVDNADKVAYIADLKRQGSEAARIQASRKEKKREVSLQKLAQKNANHRGEFNGATTPPPSQEGHAEESLFESRTPGRPSTPASSYSRSSIDVPELGVTPATSDLLLPPQYTQSNHEIKVPNSYPLYAHLHSKGYFISPGLRFGCQYMAYPGDPLRFHSHFLAVGYGWDEEIDLMDIVGGGRLGTGVKKSFLIGGLETNEEESQGDRDSSVRSWSIEWAGM